LRYAVVRTPEHVKSLFDLTAWAAHVRPKRTPVWGVSSPVAFIAVCVASGVEQMPLVYSDAGAAIENILLKALDLGLGGCWLGAFDKNKAADAIGLDKDLVCLYLIALGVPDEACLGDGDESPPLNTVSTSPSSSCAERAPACGAWF
jgi:nitroreductase